MAPSGDLDAGRIEHLRPLRVTETLADMEGIGQVYFSNCDFVQRRFYARPIRIRRTVKFLRSQTIINTPVPRSRPCHHRRRFRRMHGRKKPQNRGRDRDSPGLRPEFTGETARSPDEFASYDLNARTSPEIVCLASPNSMRVFGAKKSGLGMPANPDAIERFNTITVCALSTSMIGIP